MKVILKQIEKTMLIGEPTDINNEIEIEPDDIRSLASVIAYLGSVEKVEITFHPVDHIEDGDSE